MTNILLLGEAWGEKEEEKGRPFQGASGHMLNQLLSMVGINRDECYLTNVFNFRPKPSNDIINVCGSKLEGIPNMPSLIKGKFVKREYAPELIRLYQEINNVNPNVIVALGSTASWAISHTTGIKKIRGAAMLTSAPELARPFKVIPTLHPSAVLRDYTLRPVVVSDLDKARRNESFPHIIRPKREIWIEPSLDDLARFYEEHIRYCTRLSIDIETKLDQITCIGFAPNPHVALVVPFFSHSRPDKNYWLTRDEELIAIEYCRKWCAEKPSVFQNGLYDMHRLWRTFGITCNKQSDDTMLLHHALQPEMEKGLGFLGSVYTDEASWKFMRTATTKKEN